MDIGPAFSKSNTTKATKGLASRSYNENVSRNEVEYANYGEDQKTRALANKTCQTWAQEQDNPYLSSDKSTSSRSSKSKKENVKRHDMLYASNNKAYATHDFIGPMCLWSTLHDNTRQHCTNYCVEPLCVQHASNEYYDSNRSPIDQGFSYSKNSSSQKHIFQTETNVKSKEEVQASKEKISITNKKEHVSMKRVLAAVLAFQRWRQYQLKVPIG